MSKTHVKFGICSEIEQKTNEKGRKWSETESGRQPEGGLGGKKTFDG